MHLVIATRYDPPLALARLKARGQMTEFRLTDLRFSDDETATFLNERLRLALSPAELVNLQARTEGWAAGLRLLAGSLTRITTPTDRTAFITTLARTDRYLFDFLAEEVLRQQEPHLRVFLLETSILPELTPPLCQAITGRQDAADILEEIYRRNLFLMSIEDTAGTSYPTYRYHALFAEFLRRRLEQELPERRIDLHRRAAESSLIPGRRVAHFLAVQLWLEAAQAIEAVGEQLLAQGDFDTLRHWIESLPPELVDSRPNLLYLLGICAWRHWDLDTGRTLLQRALRGFEQNGNLAGQGETLTRLAYIFDLTADFAAGNAAIERALTCPIAPDSRIRLLMNRANHTLSQGNWPQTLADIGEALALAESINTPAILYSLTENLTWGSFSVLPGGLEQTERFYRLLQQQGNAKPLPLQAATCYVLALIYLWRGQWEQAIKTAGQAQVLSDQFGSGDWMNANLGAAIPMCYAIQGDTATSDRYFAETFQRLNAPDADQFVIAIRAVFFYWLGRIRWHQGRLDDMRAVSNQLEALSSPQEWPFMPVVRMMLRGLLAIDTGQPQQAEQYLREAAAIQERLRFTVLFSHADLLLAYLYYQQGWLAKALALFTPVLADYEARNVPGLMMWEGGRAIVPLLRLAIAHQCHPTFAAQILTLLGESATLEPAPKPALFIPQTGQTLTLRELDRLSKNNRNHLLDTIFAAKKGLWASI
jgi:LuxR family maltose regulon positive regulatory protein